MKLAGEQTLDAPRPRVWALLNDPARLARLVPGCEKLEAVGPDEFAGILNVGIASVKGVYSGKISLSDKREPAHYRIAIDGKGKQGFVRGTGTLDLVASDGNRTTVKYAGDAQVGGTLIQVGQRVMDSAAKMIIGQFFAAAEAELKAEASGTTARQGVLINFLRYLRRLIESVLRPPG